MMKINNVFIAYTSGYPVKFGAANTKAEFLAKGLILHGHHVTFVNRFYGSDNVLMSDGEKDGISFVSFPNKKNKLITLIANFNKLRVYLKSIYKPNCKNVVYVGGGDFLLTVIMIFVAKASHYKVAFIFEEWMAGMDLPLIKKLSSYMHSHYLGYLCDYILPISEYLIEQSGRFKKPLLKVPVCADFSTQPVKIDLTEKPYLLYCAGVGYQKALDFVIDTFCKLNTNYKNVDLHLILSGDSSLIQSYKYKIANLPNCNNIFVFEKLPYSQLWFEYRHARALLIPLFTDKITDIARFSQKIAEYLSSGRPVISTEVGEIKHYFCDKSNMLISAPNDIDGFVECMTYTITNAIKVEEIGLNGYLFGRDNFDFRVVSKKLSEFLLLEN